MNPWGKAQSSHHNQYHHHKNNHTVNSMQVFLPTCQRLLFFRSEVFSLQTTFSFPNFPASGKTIFRKNTNKLLLICPLDTLKIPSLNVLKAFWPCWVHSCLKHFPLLICHQILYFLCSCIILYWFLLGYSFCFLKSTCPQN